MIDKGKLFLQPTIGKFHLAFTKNKDVFEKKTKQDVFEKPVSLVFCAI